MNGYGNISTSINEALQTKPHKSKYNQSTPTHCNKPTTMSSSTSSTNNPSLKKPTHNKSSHPNPHAHSKPPPPPLLKRSKSQPSSSTTLNTKPGEATAAYNVAQQKFQHRKPTPQGSEAGASGNSQACESADVSESERGVMRKERKDVVHQGPGGEFEGK
ncbi:MAG: hypothetical protein LQ343_002005 [Gyalolechia ehrenbergii]|nr:MAG: hypothetical protein LQ343_002005 [Gyalolechia ehrenbergii]